MQDSLIDSQLDANENHASATTTSSVRLKPLVACCTNNNNNNHPDAATAKLRCQNDGNKMECLSGGGGGDGDETNKEAEIPSPIKDTITDDDDAATAPDDEEQESPVSGGSFENMSFLSGLGGSNGDGGGGVGNGIIEEIILLPNHALSDDEFSSNSDDCVYAYRGGNLEPAEFAPIQMEDETDFLEMDFDPEPNSEVENYPENVSFNYLESNFFSLRNEAAVNNLSPADFRRGSPKEEEETAVMERPESSKQEAMKEGIAEDEEESVRNTGAKPKTRICRQRTPSPDESPSAVTATSTADQKEKAYVNGVSHGPEVEEAPHQHCLECIELEFLRETKPELGAFHATCRACSRRRAAQSEADDAELARTLLKATETVAKQPPLDEDSAREQMVTIYSVNCDYQTIVEALNLIGVSPNTDRLRQYFDQLLSDETATMSVPEYLLYVSKRGCNYKKLIETIRAACGEEKLDIQFYPHDPSSNLPDLVQIHSSEITKRWNPTTDLRQILQFRNKHFRTLNVLGKIVSIIRQPERSLNFDVSICIPQYYKSGYICITRKS